MRPQLSNVPILLLRLLASPAGRTLLLSVGIWLLAVQYCRSRYWRDPHSAFFKSEHVYELKYSKFREHQALNFLAEVRNGDSAPQKLADPPEICAAFLTVKRDTQYVDAAIGSLLEGLTEEERRNLYVLVLFVDTDPTVHPTYGQPWLKESVDSAEGYNVSSGILEHLKKLEEARNFYEKGVFDYTYALDRCYEKGSPYIVMFEDDIIVADGWMAKTRAALLDLESRSYEEQRDWIYLRLFYTETSMGWQTTDFWYANMPFTFGLASLSIFTLLIFLRFSYPALRRHLDNWAVLVICIITVPSFIALFFMIGKYSLFPPHGVFEQDKYGCCTQALVFPRPQVDGLRSYLRGIGTGQTDTMIENYADEMGMKRFALAPQLVQHVGLQSSRDNTFINSQSTWAFYFETYDAETLRAEHMALVRNGQ